ncbi:uncharacterized protein [Haliotis cracherodii]|uniref:uncharacterized protein n=1 Tax=Haliotis cracherodii TaxID=6455 RepID=UPI0039E90AD5
MLLLLVTLSCLAAVKALGKPCCMERKWSATMFDVRALSKGYSITADFYYDFHNKATAIQYYQYGATQRVKANRVVTSYKKNEQYNIDADGTCTKHVPTDVLLPNCIPDDSTDFDSSYIGTEASGLKSDTWHITIGSVNLTVGVTSTNCVLTYQGMVYPGDFSLDTNAYFNGYKVGITDPAAFDIPPSC